MCARAWPLAGCVAVLSLVTACGAREQPAAETPRDTVALAETETRTDTSAQGFWRTFRDAALVGDTTRVAAMTRFPLETRGPMDDDPVQPVPRDAFADVFARVMRQDSGLAPHPETMRALIERTPSLGARELGDGEFRVGALAFAHTADGWRLVRAYLEE